jgi:hypothetical protein
MLHALALLPRRLLMGIVRGYQLIISPHLPPSCRYSPSCSVYAMQALREYGAVKGTILAVWRVLRCNPWGGHGHDPPRWFGEPEPQDAASEDQDALTADDSRTAATGAPPPAGERARRPPAIRNPHPETP